MVVKACPACGSTELRGVKRDGEVVCLVCAFEGRPVVFEDKGDYLDFLKDLKSAGTAFSQRIASLKEPSAFGSGKVFQVLTENRFIHLLFYFFVVVLLEEGLVRLFPAWLFLRSAVLVVLSVVVIQQALVLARKSK